MSFLFLLGSETVALTSDQQHQPRRPDQASDDTDGNLGRSECNAGEGISPDEEKPCRES